MIMAVITFAAGASTIFAAIVIFDIDFVKWANCSAPFADRWDRQSAICRR
ncbi:Similarity [Microcystis aeruginosa PCC 9432]|uniref:Similarity n=1 Tax=Microcystis aeruginosa PCC 9432 TaxID=1160280 RepID=A0A822L8F3_MICAE|nr:MULTISPECIES: hypothetical protein [Microcystis]CCH91327.1 Similarity [Microcystis aeruginosa PCC 9432]